VAAFLCTAAVDQLRSALVSLTSRVSTLEKSCRQSAPAPVSAAVTKKESEAAEEEDDDDFELFGSDDEVSFTSPLAGVQSVVFSMCVCLFVCPLAYLKRPHVQISPNFLHMLPVAMVQCSSDGNAIHYVPLVSWITSCFHAIEGIDVIKDVYV